MSRVPSRLDALVRDRAGHRCEYCRLPVVSSVLPFEVEHIIPLKHKGKTNMENLALACLHCNRHKGVNIAGLVQPGDRLVRLFHPRRDIWKVHFRQKSGLMIAGTQVGTVTIEVLEMNDAKQVELRRMWLA
jgi:5-methylcytosine-specific restriction endonuclease McrA